MLTLLNSLLAKVLEGMQLLEAANENIHKPGIKRLARLLHIQWNDHSLPGLHLFCTDRRETANNPHFGPWQCRMPEASVWKGPWGRTMTWTTQPNYCSKCSVEGSMDSLSHPIPQTPLPTYIHNCFSTMIYRQLPDLLFNSLSSIQ